MLTDVWHVKTLSVLGHIKSKLRPIFIVHVIRDPEISEWETFLAGTRANSHLYDVMNVAQNDVLKLKMMYTTSSYPKFENWYKKFHKNICGANPTHFNRINCQKNCFSEILNYFLIQGKVINKKLRTTIKHAYVGIH